MGFDVSLVATEWFLCLFSKSLPSEVLFLKKHYIGFFGFISFAFVSYIENFCLQTTLRVWDVLFYEGAKVLFHAALAIFKVLTSLPFDQCFFFHKVKSHFHGSLVYL